MKLKTYTVRTTKRDIREWINNDACDCPVKASLKRQGVRVVVYSDRIEHRRKLYPLMPRITKWIHGVDSDRRLRPITFKIKLPV